MHYELFKNSNYDCTVIAGLNEMIFIECTDNIPKKFVNRWVDTDSNNLKLMEIYDIDM